MEIKNLKIKSQKLVESKGFSLIELLVVISIIGILIALSAFGLKNARESSRDARRKSDLETIRSALELYKSDKGAYPDSLNKLGDSPVYLVVPTDPLFPARSYAYTSVSPYTTYTLCASLEGSTDTVSGCGSCTETCRYKTTNP